MYVTRENKVQEFGLTILEMAVDQFAGAAIISQTGWLQQHGFIALYFWRLEVKDQAGSMVDFL